MDFVQSLRHSSVGKCHTQHSRTNSKKNKAVLWHHVLTSDTLQDRIVNRNHGSLWIHRGSRGPKRRLAQPFLPLRAHPAHTSVTFATVPALLIAACTAVAFLAAAAIFIFLLLRPLLKRLEALALACEAAAREVEKASAEFNLASVVINSDLPTTLDSMERASLEFEELGQSLNGLTGALWRTKTSTPKTPRSRVKGGAAKQEVSKDAGLENAVPPEAAVMHEMNPVEALQAGTVNSIRKVAQDVSALAAALTPAMIAWRKRLSFITERFEAANSKQKELPVAIAKVDNESKKEVSSQNASDLQEPSKASPVSNINKEDGTPASSEPLPALQRLSDSVQETPSQEEWQDQVEALQKRVESEAAGGKVSLVASELARAATEVADVARASLSSADEQDTSGAILGLEAREQSADLLEKAAEAAHALSREAQKAVEVESKFEALRELRHFPEDVDLIKEHPVEPETDAPNDKQLSVKIDDQRKAAQAVFVALANAEEAASAAAAASGALESALQKAEEHAGVSWWGWNSHKLFRPAAKKEPQVSLEPQEHDGMAYPCSNFIASRASSETATSLQEPPNAETKRSTEKS